jgi:dipeptidyl aminopeptidase/acylaminoacyl peptidase
MTGNVFRVVFRPLLSLWLLSFTVDTLARPLPQGALPPLNEGEGYLLTVVDTDTFLLRLHLDRLGHMLGTQRLENIEPGRQLQVLAVPAGEYRWTRAETAMTFGIGQLHDPVATARLFGKQRFDIKNLDASIRFTIEAGKLNYPGDLHFRKSVHGRALSMAMPNRGERALEMLAWRHGEPPRGLAVRYAGPQRDVYWSHREAGWTPPASVGCPDNTDDLPHGKPDAGDLFLAEEIRDLQFSPDGGLVLETAYRDNQYRVTVIDPENGDLVALYAGIASVGAAHWAGERRVVVELRSSSGVTGTHLFTLAPGSLRGQSPVRTRFPVQGFVLDPLPDDGNSLLFGVFRPGHADPLQIFRVDLSRRTLEAKQFEARKRIDRILDNDLAWISDRRGQLRLAVVENDSSRELMYRADGKSAFTRLRTLGTESIFDPAWLSPDGSIFALSNEGRDQVDLVRVDPDAPDTLETVHAIPGIDIARVETAGSDGRIVGVSYYEGGHLRSHFFEDSIRSWHTQLLTRFPGHYAEPVDIDAAHGRALVKVSSDTAPPRYFHFDVASGRAIHVGDGAPWLAAETFIPRQAIDVPGQDGRTVQALLAIPETGSPRPLLLMPHGGPFLVQDVLRFDRDVQYWATRGFAVLQVNFRGSYGFGVQHLLEGFAGFGRQIEDDIMAALNHVVAEHRGRIDAGRICAVGSSYGGYSSLMLTLRDPALIRCAVSIAGPTDLPLLYMASDWNSSAATTDAMRRVLGDPADPALVTHSPLYRADEFTRPVMLIHGGTDRRVDLEHSARLATRLDRLDKPYELVRLEQMGHGADTVSQNVCVLGHAERFIRTQLGMDAAAARPAP